ncbi:MAG: DUF6580 family putative transport protein [Gemmataceae bacterium]
MTNLACWLSWYPHTPHGLTTWYVAALPLFHDTLLGDVIFLGVLFGVLSFVESCFPIFYEPHLTAPA